MSLKKEKNILEINIVFFVTALLLLTVGAIVQSLDVKIGLLVTEFILILLPPLIYLKFKGVSLSSYLRLKRLNLKHGLLIVAITTLSYPVALFFNLIILTLLSTIGPIQQPPIPVAGNLVEYIVLMVVIAISAGVCEEVFFRGMLLRGYEKLGMIQAIALSSIFFGIFHFNIQNMAGPIFLGILFGYLVIKTDSLYAGIIGHITNNGVAVTIGFLTNTANKKLLEENPSLIQKMPETFQLMASTVLIGMIALVTGLIAFFLLRIIIKDTKVEVYRDIEEIEIIETEPKKFPVLQFIPVYLIIAIFIFLGYLQISNMIL